MIRRLLIAVFSFLASCFAVFALFVYLGQELPYIELSEHNRIALTHEAGIHTRTEAHPTYMLMTLETIFIPAWMPVVWFGAYPVGFCVGRVFRRALSDSQLCEECGYNLFGNFSGHCPECGTPTMTQESGSQLA